MTTQDYARIYGLDIPAKVRINQSGDRLCLTDMNEALIVGPHGELIDRMSNPWAKTYVSAKSYDFSADDYVPFMDDCINPRTGLKGYEGEWTDDDFRKYFDITDSEWEDIKCTMKPYL